MAREKKAAEPELVRVRFLVRDAPWDAGQVVELEPAQAEKLVRHGVAERVD